MMRCDRGTENISLATYQVAFRSLHSDLLSGQRSIIYGKSSANIVSYINIKIFSGCIIRCLQSCNSYVHAFHIFIRELRLGGQFFGSPKLISGLHILQ